jgi:membrane protein implicated in regulation of membrane protease activity
MPDWVAWAIAAAALGVGEAATAAFVLGPIALAAAAAAAVAAAGAGLLFQVIAFIAGSIASLVLLRPIARRHISMPAHLRSGTDALVGAPATVLERIDANGGRVKIGGEVWTARCYDDERVLEPGTRVEVLKIDGATALVSE